MFGWYDPRAGLAPPLVPRTPWLVPRRFARRFIRTFILTWILLIAAAWVGAPVLLTYISISPPTWTTLKQWRAPFDSDPHTLRVQDLGELPFPAEAVAFRTPDGLLLRGW